MPEKDLAALLRHLETVQAAQRDSLIQMLMDAPLDNEPTTPEEDAGAVEARQERTRGEGKSLSEVRTALLRG